MKQVRVSPVIMAGGASSRLWPASNREKPKWDLHLGGGKSLLEQAWERARSVAPAADCRVVAGVAQAELVRGALPELPAQNLLVEPVPRDTSGAIALAAAAILASSKNRKLETRCLKPVMLVLPGDHIIRPLARFRDCVRAGTQTAVERNALVTFGIKPRKPATGYGYIHCGAEIRNPQSATRSLPPVFRALSFLEKPALLAAKRYLASGEHYWNGGIFLWTLDALMAEFSRQLAGHAALVGALSATRPGGKEWTGVLRKRFPALRKISIDFGIMEHARDVAVVAADFEWDDIGSWSAVGQHLRPRGGNACDAGTRMFALDAHGNVLFAPGKRVALLGVEGLAVVASGGDILVCKLDRDQDVRQAGEAIFR